MFKGRLVVELDDELHFNRYALTLEASWAASCLDRAHYRRHCAKHEPE
jgi:hypothetical protein